MAKAIPFPGEERFRRVDWRPSKKRASSPRQRDWGGAKRAPLAFKIAAAASGFGSGKQARCRHCRRFAFAATGLCRYHNGMPRDPALYIAKRRKPYQRKAKP